ncbi:MAG: hypothetical protein M5U09_27585 [Gammaproteobacteria bacterium]|nr:hypothetical protein [Gammaproteobacteria bacterium]
MTGGDKGAVCSGGTAPFEIAPLAPALGAEVRGVDWRRVSTTRSSRHSGKRGSITRC